MTRVGEGNRDKGIAQRMINKVLGSTVAVVRTPAQRTQCLGQTDARPLGKRFGGGGSSGVDVLG